MRQLVSGSGTHCVCNEISHYWHWVCYRGWCCELNVCVLTIFYRAFGDCNTDDSCTDGYHCLSYLWHCQSECVKFLVIPAFAYWYLSLLDRAFSSYSYGGFGLSWKMLHSIFLHNKCAVCTMQMFLLLISLLHQCSVWIVGQSSTTHSIHDRSDIWCMHYWPDDDQSWSQCCKLETLDQNSGVVRCKIILVYSSCI